MVRNRRTDPEVIVIGIDGASWNVLNLMMKAGAMPNFRRLTDTGVSGNLTSTILPISAPAWTSFMTGKNPGKRGIFSWTEALNRQFVPVNARKIDGKTRWQDLSHARDQGVLLYPRVAKGTVETILSLWIWENKTHGQVS